MADLNLNELRAVAQQGVAANRFWNQALAILDAVPIAQNLVNEAAAQQVKLKADLVALQDKVRAAADDAKTQMNEIDRTLASKIAGAQTAADAAVQAMQQPLAALRDQIDAAQAQYDSLLAGQKEQAKAGRAKADEMIRQAQAQADAIYAKLDRDRQQMEAAYQQDAQTFQVKRTEKQTELDVLESTIGAAQNRLNSLNIELKSAREKFASVLGG